MSEPDRELQQQAGAGAAGLIGLAALMRQAFSGQDLAPVGKALIGRAQSSGQDGSALMDLSTVLHLMGQRETALATQREALTFQSHYHVPTASGDNPLRVLALMAPGDLMANSPVEFLLEDSDVRLELLYVGPGVAEPAHIPEHDVLFVAIAESEDNVPVLEILADLFKEWPRPVINRPELISRLSRDRVCGMLNGVDGMLVPVCRRVDRATLEEACAKAHGIADLLEGADFPVIVRPVDSHAGYGLACLNRPVDLEDYLSRETAQAFFISPFVDYRSGDGLFRKYRIVLIAGRPFLCHMAVSEHWMIHYLNAGMLESAEKRAEEARAMAGFDTDFARRHGEALRAIHERIGLDYVGIDCAVAPDGRLLVFEVDSCMIVHAMDPVETFPYKQPQMRRLFAAFRDMLIAASEAGAKV